MSRIIGSTKTDSFYRTPKQRRGELIAMCKETNLKLYASKFCTIRLEAHVFSCIINVNRCGLKMLEWITVLNAAWVTTVRANQLVLRLPHLQSESPCFLLVSAMLSICILTCKSQQAQGKPTTPQAGWTAALFRHYYCHKSRREQQESVLCRVAVKVAIHYGGGRPPIKRVRC